MPLAPAKMLGRLKVVAFDIVCEPTGYLTHTEIHSLDSLDKWWGRGELSII